jgi:hypothetical protein
LVHSSGGGGAGVEFVVACSVYTFKITNVLLALVITGVRRFFFFFFFFCFCFSFVVAGLASSSLRSLSSSLFSP